jgi:hypothetical protein
MNERTAAQLRLISDIHDAMSSASVPWWLFGGWGVDGRVTREHGDIEIWVSFDDTERTREALLTTGFTVLPSRYPEESYEYVKDGIEASSAFFLRRDDGSFGVRGRWSDWRFPPSSFIRPPGRIGGLVLPAMSVEGMLAMKEQYPTLRNGRPFREKDVYDIEVLRRLLLRCGEHDN